MDLIAAALEEDIGSGDITSDAIVPRRAQLTVRIIAKEPGVICGLPLLKRIFTDARIMLLAHEGQQVRTQTAVAEIRGNARFILSRERVALNILQRLSGIATLTSACVAAAGGRAAILDTRKTTPGLRSLEKYAVRTGGGRNHRFGLYDMVLIKSAHISIAGSITTAITRARAATSRKIEVEVRTLAQLREALAAEPDIIMLDNMPLREIRRAVALTAGRIPLEASGGMGPETIARVAKLGIRLISVGALTHSSRALDLSMKVVSYGPQGG